MSSSSSSRRKPVVEEGKDDENNVNYIKYKLLKAKHKLQSKEWTMELLGYAFAGLYFLGAMFLASYVLERYVWTTSNFPSTGIDKYNTLLPKEQLETKLWGSTYFLLSMDFFYSLIVSIVILLYTKVEVTEIVFVLLLGVHICAIIGSGVRMCFLIFYNIDGDNHWFVRLYKSEFTHLMYYSIFMFFAVMLLNSIWLCVSHDIRRNNTLINNSMKDADEE
jgi:hypothetical protein